MFQTLGEIEFTTVCDGWFSFRAKSFFANAPLAVVRAAMAAHGVADPDWVNAPFHCLLVKIEGHIVLIDTGYGKMQATTGHLIPELARIGIAPEQIDTVILSHAHPDHIGGAVRPDGTPAFPQARYVLSQAEWDYWHGLEKPPSFVAIQGKLRDQLDLIDGEADVLPGLRLIPTPGHTPGHVSVLLSSGDQQMLYTGDTIAHPIHLDHMDWHIVGDVDPAQALRSRRWVVDRARESHWRLFIYHYHDPVVENV